MRTLVCAVAAALAVVVSISELAAAPAVEGTWTVTEHTDDRVQLTLRWGSSTWGQSVARTELLGLSDREIASTVSTPVTFRVVREAGIFTLEGSFRDGSGSGRFRFEPNRQFVSTIRSLGVAVGDGVSDRDLMALALARASAAVIREFTDLGFARLTQRQIVEMAIHHVTPEYVRGMRSLGVADIDQVARLVEMRIHQVTPEYVRELQALGYRDVPTRRLVEMRIHRVTPALIREYQALGFDDLSPRQLIEMRIHGVTPAFIREVRDAGFQDLSPATLVRMKIHGVDRAVIRGGRSGSV